MNRECLTELRCKKEAHKRWKWAQATWEVWRGIASVVRGNICIAKSQLQWEPAMGAKGNEEALKSTLAAEARLRERWPCSSLGLSLVTTDPE